jgi:hypothetical protein
MNLDSVSAAGRLAAIKKTAMAYSVQGIRYKWQFHIWRVSFVTADGMECHAIAFPSFLTSHRITRVKKSNMMISKTYTNMIAITKKYETHQRRWRFIFQIKYTHTIVHPCTMVLNRSNIMISKAYTNMIAIRKKYETHQQRWRFSQEYFPNQIHPCNTTSMNHGSWRTGKAIRGGWMGVNQNSSREFSLCPKFYPTHLSSSTTKTT